MEPSTAQLAAAAIGAGSVLVGTALTQAVAFLTEGRRQRLESNSRWHENRRRLASAVVSEAMRIENLLKLELDSLPADGRVREQMQRLGYHELSDVPEDARLDGLDEVPWGFLLDLVHRMSKHIESAEQHVADLTMVSGDEVDRAGQVLIMSLLHARIAVNGLLPRDRVRESLQVIQATRRNFQAAIRDELNAGKRPSGRLRRRLRREQRMILRLRDWRLRRPIR